MKFSDLTGLKFHRLTVLNRVPNEKGKPCRWNCACECGNFAEVVSNKLTSGWTKSCGCFSRDVVKARATTHGHSKGSTYSSWSCMITRCTNKNHQQWNDYGGRGVVVADRWRSFENFLEDIGERPNGKSIDRFPNKDGNYEPGNCRWASRLEQANNKRNSHYLEYMGETLTIAEVARKCGVCQSQLWKRIVRNGLSVERAIISLQ